MTWDDIERAIEWFSDEKEYFVNMEGLPFADAIESENYRKGRMALDTALTALREARDRMEGCDRCQQQNCDTCRRMNADGMCIIYERCRQATYKHREWLHDRDHYRPYPYCRWCGRQLEGGAQNG